MKEMPDYAKREVMSCLRDLADQTLQERTWLQEKPGGPASPVELVCQLFDDTALSDYLAKARGAPLFSSSVDTLLREISGLLSQVDLDLPPRLLLREPQWQEVQTKAAEAAQQIDELLRE
jgi:hypothetical protein